MENKAVIPLFFLEEGEEGIVEEILGGERLISRLAGFGIVEGVNVKVLRNIHGLIMVLASDTRVALGRGEAKKILVRKTKIGEEKKKEKKYLLVALAGQPNVGKSTVFNILTGLSQHVGNWPGKTVEKKEGIYTGEDVVMRIVDLPGTYSLSSFSEEERIARDFILKEKPDVIALIANATALERSLYLLSELLLLGPPVVLGVNMLDVADRQGINIDFRALRESLGIPVVPMVATKNRGIKELLQEIENLAEKRVVFSPKIPQVAKSHLEIFNRLIDLLDGHIPDYYPKEWCATKLMEGDKEVIEEVEKNLPVDVWNQIKRTLLEHEDALRAVVGGRYDWIENVARSAIKRFKPGQVLITDRIDHILTNPAFGVPVLIGVLALILGVTYKIGLPMQSGLEDVFFGIGRFVVHSLNLEDKWVSGLIVDGIIGGAGRVVSFTPILAIFFFALSLLEDTGYIARVAFVMDKFMHIIGLHGKSFLPLCLGFGCNVPAILTSRIVESKKGKLLTIFLAPFVPCAARLGVLTFLTGAIFSEKATFVMLTIVALNIVVLIILGFALSRFMKLESLPFIMELPLYHKPNFKNVLTSVTNRVLSFVKRAGSIILLLSIFIWLFSHIPEGTIEESYLGKFGKGLERVGYWFGLDWRLNVALLSSLVAKENSIATLGVLYGAEEEGLRKAISENVSHASLISFLVILMLFIPCFPTIAVIRSEVESKKWFIGQFLVMLLVSFVSGFLAFRIALFFNP